MLEFKVTTELNFDQVKRQMEAAAISRLVKCGFLVEAEMKRALSKGKRKPQTVKLGDKKVKYITLASEPGTPPHLQTGNLRASIRTAQTPEGTVVIGPTTTAWYGRVHEFGGKHHPARPFARPALASAVKKFPKQFEGLLK